jgi:hypothetical protein
MKVSQSLIKGLQDYILGKECGYVFKAKNIDGRYDLFPPSEAQNVGAWFEYMATGSIPKNGAVPQAEYMKRGKDENGNPELTAPYRLMKKQVENYRKIIESITTRHGVVLVFKIKNNKMTLFKKIESKNNLRQDVRNTLSFRTKILPLLLEDPKIKFIIQYAHAC